MKPIEIVARELEIAPIRIHQLIRQNKVQFKADYFGVYVTEAEIVQFFESHPDIYTIWKENYNHNQRCRLQSSIYKKE